MAKKIKFKQTDNGVIQLQLTAEEATLIIGYLRATRLGNEDKYKRAAFSLLDAFDGFTDIDAVEDEIDMGASIEVRGGQYDVIIEVNDKEDYANSHPSAWDGNEDPCTEGCCGGCDKGECFND